MTTPEPAADHLEPEEPQALCPACDARLAEGATTCWRCRGDLDGRKLPRAGEYGAATRRVRLRVTILSLLCLVSYLTMVLAFGVRQDLAGILLASCTVPALVGIWIGTAREEAGGRQLHVRQQATVFIQVTAISFVGVSVLLLVCGVLEVLPLAFLLALGLFALTTREAMDLAREYSLRGTPRQAAEDPFRR